MKKLFLLSIALLLFSPSFLMAQQKQQQQEGVLVYEEPTGIKLEWNKDGSTWIRIRSTGEAELAFTDNKEILSAKRKATLRAKDAIGKFLSERIKSENVMDNIYKTLLNKNTDGTSSAKRESIETELEKISNSSEAILKGVITLAEDVNIEKKTVKVEVGCSHKTMKAADQVKTSIQDNLDKAGAGSSKAPSEGKTPESYKTKSKNYKDF